MDRECPECKGEMYYEQSTKHFICKSCGLYVTREDIYKLLDRKRVDKKKSRELEYLDWWLSSKKR